MNGTVASVVSGMSNVLNPPLQESTLIWMLALFFLVGAFVGGILIAAHDRRKRNDQMHRTTKGR